MTRLILSVPQKVSDRIQVSGDEHHYLFKVRRHTIGDRIEVRGPDGLRFTGRIEHIDRLRAEVLLVDELPRVNTCWPVTIAVSVPKRALMDDIVRKLSELGVQRIVPLETERSVLKPGPSKLDRWRKIAGESLRQCGRATPLQVDEVTRFADGMEMLRDANTKLILHPDPSTVAFPSILGPHPLASPVCVAVGPEGGFSDPEIAIARSLGFAPVGLGNSILRIETAAITAGVLCVAMLGGFK